MSDGCAGGTRPPVHLLAAESELVARLALSAEARQPAVAAMLLDEIERADLHSADEMPPGHVMLNSQVSFTDEATLRTHRVQLVLPADADIAESRISILTPMGAALYGLAAGACIDWPNRDGKLRPIRILRVDQPAQS
jgi:regulator of nucleoside diphosphate kinase